MKFKIDENLPIEVAQLLNQAGYDAMTVYEQNLGGEIEVITQGRGTRKFPSSYNETV